MQVLSVIVPVFNEEANLLPLYDRLCQVSAGLREPEFEFLFVDDGSTDATPEILRSLAQSDPRVRAVHFARNFGSHPACLAGLSEARGDLMLILAADLQDPPELVPRMLEKLDEGFDVVFATRSDRDDPWLTLQLSRLYHIVMRRVAFANWPAQGADMVLLRREVRDVLVAWRQKNTSLFAQVLWVGFRQASIPYRKQARRAGRSKWTWRKKYKLFFDSVVSFSATPLRFASLCGAGLLAGGMTVGGVVLARWLGRGGAVSGAGLLAALLLACSGVQLLVLGLLGEYLWRVADEVRGAPPYIICERRGFDVSGSAGENLRSEETKPAQGEAWLESLT